MLWAHVEGSPFHSEVCHGVSWQGWLKAQGNCVTGNGGDGSHGKLGLVDANILLFNCSLDFTNTCDVLSKCCY